MNTNMRFLNSSESANQFLTLAATEAGARAFVGDHEKLEDAEVSAAVLNAATALRDGVATVERLAKDLTRTKPMQNEAASKIADRTAGEIEKAKAIVDRRITALWESGANEADTTFAPNLQRSHLDAEIIRYVREQAVKPDGIVKVHELVKTNRNVAAVIYQTESFLLGVADKTHEAMKLDAIKKHAPNAYAKMERSATMTELPERLTRAAANVRRFFFDPIERAKTGTRVNIE